MRKVEKKKASQKSALLLFQDWGILCECVFTLTDLVSLLSLSSFSSFDIIQSEKTVIEMASELIINCSDSAAQSLHYSTQADLSEQSI